MPAPITGCRHAENRLSCAPGSMPSSDNLTITANWVRSLLLHWFEIRSSPSLPVSGWCRGVDTGYRQWPEVTSAWLAGLETGWGWLGTVGTLRLGCCGSLRLYWQTKCDHWSRLPRPRRRGWPGPGQLGWEKPSCSVSVKTLGPRQAQDAGAGPSSTLRNKSEIVTHPHRFSHRYFSANVHPPWKAFQRRHRSLVLLRLISPPASRPKWRPPIGQHPARNARLWLAKTRRCHNCNVYAVSVDSEISHFLRTLAPMLPGSWNFGKTYFWKIQRN